MEQKKTIFSLQKQPTDEGVNDVRDELICHDELMYEDCSSFSELSVDFTPRFTKKAKKTRTKYGKGLS